MMSLKSMAAVAVMASVMTPMAMLAQTTHADAKEQVEAKDARHHNKAKIVGGSTVAGAATGAAVAGPAGAVVGAGVGAVGGSGCEQAPQASLHQEEGSHRHTTVVSCCLNPMRSPEGSALLYLPEGT